MPRSVLPLLALLASSAPVVAGAELPNGDRWIEYDRRQGGWAETPYEYDAASVQRRNDRVRTRVRYTWFLSGLPDMQYFVDVEIDCARWSTRALKTRILQGVMERPPTGREPWSPIETGMPAESLAKRLC